MCVRQLWVDYKPRFFWWEVAELLRKLTLTGLLVLIQKDELLRVLVASTLSGFFLVAQLVYKPYQWSSDNLTSALTHACTTLVFQCVLLLKVCNKSREACVSFGSGENGDGLFLLYTIFSLLFMLVMLLSGIYHLVRETTRATGVLYLRETGAVPELALSQGTAYHLFLSHVWSSAQDQVAVIKRCGSGPSPPGCHHARTRPCSFSRSPAS